MLSFFWTLHVQRLFRWKNIPEKVATKKHTFFKLNSEKEKKDIN